MTPPTWVEMVAVLTCVGLAIVDAVGEDVDVDVDVGEALRHNCTSSALDYQCVDR